MNPATKSHTRVSVPATQGPHSVLVPPGANDWNTLKPTRQVSCDRDGKGSTHLLKCKKRTIFSTFNARTLSKDSKLLELVSCARSFNIDILSIQEHRIYHLEIDTDRKTIDGYHLITSSAWKNSQGSKVGGVGILLSARAAEQLKSVVKISPRILVAYFYSNQQITIIACYSPTNVIDELTVDQFYKDLKDATDAVPAHNLLVVAGDFNAQIGPEDSLFTFNTKETNRNEKKLADYAEEFQLLVTNTKFMKPANKLWTFQLPSGKRTQIDYVLVRKKWKNSIMNCQAYLSFSSVGSDHRVVSCTIRLSLRQSKKPIRNPMKEIDWKYVYATPEVSSAFTLEVRNRFDALAKPDDDVETSYNNLISATQEIALEKLPKKKKQKEKPLSNHTLINVARKAVREAAAKHELNPTRSSLRKLTKAKAQLDEPYVNAEAECIEKKLDQIGNLSSSNQHTTVWPTINDLAGRKSKPSIRIKGESAKKRKESWLSYFLNLLGGQPPNTLGNRALPLIQIAKLLDISTSTFTIQELEDAIKSLRSNKAPGLDNIPSLIWKDPLFHDLLLRFCNHTFSSLRPPSAWMKSGIEPIPKKMT